MKYAIAITMVVALCLLVPSFTLARNIGTGIVNTTITNETGTYQFPSLQPGTYQVSAELPGFQTATYNNVVLGGAQQVRLNFSLQVGDVATTVEVTAATDTALATTSASIASVLPDARVRDVPLGNHPVFANPVTNINSPNFGLIDTAFDGRKFTLGAALEFLRQRRRSKMN